MRCPPRSKLVWAVTAAGAMRQYLRAKIAWLEGGERGKEAAFWGGDGAGVARKARAR